MRSIDQGVRRFLQIAAGIAIALTIASECYAVTCPPPPEPVNPNGHGAVLFYRDIESCRIFTYNILYTPERGYYGLTWTENPIDELRRLIVDKGQRVAFIE